MYIHVIIFTNKTNLARFRSIFNIEINYLDQEIRIANKYKCFIEVDI